MTTGSKINASEYNAIRTKVEQVLGAGGTSPITGLADPTFGYGQTLESVPVIVSDSVEPSGLNIVKRSQWLALRNDIVKIKLHQDGVEPPIADVPVDGIIRYGTSFPNTNFDFIVTQSAQPLNKFKISEFSSIKTQEASTNTSVSWSNLAECELVVSFSNADDARYFFNSGGKIVLSSSRSGGSATAQNNAWTSLLTSVGFVSFSATSSNKNFYNLTSTYETFFEQVASGDYSSNRFIIFAKCDVPDNSAGTATEVYLRIQWRDLYTDANASPPPDQVNGALSLIVEEFRSASFTLTGPDNYLLSPIVAA